MLIKRVSVWPHSLVCGSWIVASSTSKANLQFHTWKFTSTEQQWWPASLVALWCLTFNFWLKPHNKSAIESTFSVVSFTFSLPLCCTFGKTPVPPRPVAESMELLVSLFCPLWTPVAETLLFRTEQCNTSWTRSGLDWLRFGLLRSVSVRCPLRPSVHSCWLESAASYSFVGSTHIWPPEGANVLNVNTWICVYLHRYLIYFLE